MKEPLLEITTFTRDITRLALRQNMAQTNVKQKGTQLHVVGHYSHIKSAQAIEKVKNHLDTLKAQNPKLYGSCVVEETSSKTPEQSDLYHFKENGQTLCSITHTANGDITVTFNTTDPKYFDLALRYIENCQQQRAQLSGKLGESHVFQSHELNITAEPNVPPKTILMLYQEAKMAMLKGNNITISPDSLALLGPKDSDIFKEYLRFENMSVEKLKELHDLREMQRSVAAKPKTPPSTPTPPQNMIQWT